MIDQQIVREWWRVFKSEETLTECRVLGGRGKGGYSGYFDNVDTMLKALTNYQNLGIYSTLNSVSEGCNGRKQWGYIEERPESTTSDNDVVGRRWILIDIDPTRPSNTNSTDEEKSYAREVMIKVGTFLRDNGFSPPVVADSANGYHLYYKVQLKIDEERNKLIKEFLEVMDGMFSTDNAKIDTQVGNPSRIVKVIGTSSVKGANTETRPQRMSRFIRVPYSIEYTDIAFIRKIAETFQKQKSNAISSYGIGNFDLDEFIVSHNISVEKRTRFSGGEKIILTECPFDSNHKAPDAALFKLTSGAYGFKCLHSSCSHHGFHDFRIFYDPEAYDTKTRDEYKLNNQYYSRTYNAPQYAAIEQENDEKGKKWKPLSTIKWVDPNSMVYIPTGIEKLDRKIMGLGLGDLTIMTGIAGSGKTSLIDFIILNVVNRGYKVAVWSGELQETRFKSWIVQAAAGRNNVRKMPRYDDKYYAPKDVAMQVCRWLDGKLWLYNNDYGNKWKQIFSDLQEMVDKENVHLAVLDNLMALALGYTGDKNEQQSQFVNDLKDYAKKKNIHVILVCHPRKEMGNALLRMESISGSADLFGTSDNVLIAHRAGIDFDNRAKGVFSAARLIPVAGCDEVVEIAKNRESGLKDYLIGLWYEIETRRFKNTMDEFIVYGWNDIIDGDLPL